MSCANCKGEHGKAECPCLEDYHGVTFDTQLYTKAGKVDLQDAWGLEFRNIGSTVCFINGKRLFPPFRYSVVIVNFIQYPITVSQNNLNYWKPDLLGCERDTTIYKISFVPVISDKYLPFPDSLTGNILEVTKKYKGPVRPADRATKK